MNTTIQINGISVAYGHKRVLSNIYLNIESGFIHGLIGPNGAGKSSLFKCILGQVKPSAGEIFIYGEAAGKSLKKIAINKYFFIHNPTIDLEMHIFLCNKWKGVPKESEEMKPRWFKVDKIPYKKMWDSDKYWIPLILKGKKLRCKSYVDDKDITIKREIKVVKTL